MKRVLFSFVLLTCLFFTNSFASEWITGTYINQDKNGVFKEIVFCEDGKAFPGAGHRTYKVIQKNNEKYIVLNSSGIFTFKLSKDKKQLIAADNFTKSWATKSSLVLDSSRKDTCNW